jgi:hypothetical protein
MSRCAGICLVVAFSFHSPAVSGQLASIGTVLDAATGLPIQGAVVRVVAAGSATSGPSAAILASGRSEPDGTFYLNTTVQGVLEVSAQGYAVKRLHWPSADAREIRLEHGATIRIRVIDETAASIPRAILTIRTLHPGNVVTDVRRTNEGLAEFLEWPSGPTTIIARAEGMAPAALSLNVLPAGRYDAIAMILLPAASVQGVVRDSAGRLRPEATIVANYAGDLPLGRELRNFISRGKPSEDVNFDLRNLVPHIPIQLYAESNGSRSDAVTLVLNPGEQRSNIVLILN